MTTQTATTTTALLICLALLIVAEAQASGKWQSGGEDAAKELAGGEKVDRLTSATGDLIWPGQLEWLLLQQVPGSNSGQHLRLQQAPSDNSDNLYLDANLPSSTTTVGLDGPAGANMRTYHDDLVDEFKQYARGLVNPSRESRAFKPKLMSTARGFGKRAFPSRITYSDLLEAANPNGAIQSHGKMSEAALSSKYADWISQALARWPTMSKYLNDKYLDHNGDGIISMDEKYQSL